MSQRLQQAVEDFWGPRCEDFDATCEACQAWRELDQLQQTQHTLAAVANEIAAAAPLAEDICPCCNPPTLHYLAERVTRVSELLQEGERNATDPIYVAPDAGG